jgi:hypothetical protein
MLRNKSPLMEHLQHNKGNHVNYKYDTNSMVQVTYLFCHVIKGTISMVCTTLEAATPLKSNMSPKAISHLFRLGIPLG